MKNITNAKYVVESHCTNGNVFLHGPFRSKSAADEYILECEYDTMMLMELDSGPTMAMATHKVRAIFNPKGWTRSVK